MSARWCITCRAYRVPRHDHEATLWDPVPDEYGLLVPHQPIERHIDGLPPAVRFDGETYVPAIDAERLGTQAKAVFVLMEDQQWRSLAEISQATGHPEASVSARLRDFRKQKFGASRVDRRRRSAGTWEYRLIVVREDLQSGAAS